MRTLDSSRDKKQERKIKTNKKERQKEPHSEGKELFYRLAPSALNSISNLLDFTVFNVALPIKACTVKVVSGNLQKNILSTKIQFILLYLSVLTQFHIRNWEANFSKCKDSSINKRLKKRLLGFRYDDDIKTKYTIQIVHVNLTDFF